MPQVDTHLTNLDSHLSSVAERSRKVGAGDVTVLFRLWCREELNCLRLVSAGKGRNNRLKSRPQHSTEEAATPHFSKMASLVF